MRRRTRGSAAVLAAVLLAACSHASPRRSVASAPPIAERARVELTPLGLSPDGEARLLVTVRYRTRDGRPATVRPGGNVDVTVSRGSVQWQPRARFGGPAAIVRLTESGPLRIRVTSDLPRLPHVLERTTDTRAWRLPHATARALGARSVEIGWFPRVASGDVRIVRTGNGPALTTDVTAPSSSWRDPTATPAAHYTYAVAVPGRSRIVVAVDMPPDLPPSTPADIAGKAMWLDADGMSVAAIGTALDRAREAGLHALLVRMTYGEMPTVSPAGRTAFAALVDGAAARDLRVIAWVVPRAVSYEDLAAAVAAAAYRTPAGNALHGLAVDLERGTDFLATDGDGGPLAQYVAELRTAVGPSVLIVATVEDPVLESLPPGAVPYSQIAQSADVLQPMAYWRAQARFASHEAMTAFLQRSYAEIRKRSGGLVPVDIGGVTAAIDPKLGPPPPADVAASIAQSQSLGALGETLYRLNGTTDAQWHAIGAQTWDAVAGPDGTR